MGLAEILGMMVFGLIAGAIARFLTPGTQPMGCLWTMALGVAGSFVGGFIAFLIWGGPAFRTTGWIGSVIGAVLLLLLFRRRSRW